MGKHSSRFVHLVDETRRRVRECTVTDLKQQLDARSPFHLLDVREAHEYAADHIPGAVHLGKGVLERDIEISIPALDAPIMLYCGGGYRSALAADNLQRMGYTNVTSVDGGFRGWLEAGYPTARFPGGCVPEEC